MSNKNIINSFIKLGIRTWLKNICTRIKIETLKLSLNQDYFGRIDNLYLEAGNLIYQNFYINKVIVQIDNCNVKFNYKSHLLYSEDMIINCSLIIDNRNLENIFFQENMKD